MAAVGDSASPAAAAHKVAKMIMRRALIRQGSCERGGRVLGDQCTEEPLRVSMESKGCWIRGASSRAGKKNQSGNTTGNVGTRGCGVVEAGGARGACAHVLGFIVYSRLPEPAQDIMTQRSGPGRHTEHKQKKGKGGLRKNVDIETNLDRL